LDVGLLGAQPELSALQAVGPVPRSIRDLNFVLGEVTWELLESVVCAAAVLAERVGFGGQYRGSRSTPTRVIRRYPQLSRPDRTLTADEVETCQQPVIAPAAAKLAHGCARRTKAPFLSLWHGFLAN